MTGALMALLLAAPDAGVLLALPVQIRADHASSLIREGQATYSGHVRAVRGTLVLTSDTMKALLDPQGQVQHLSASGDVHAVDGEREAWGEEAEYEAATGVLVVRGHPRGRSGVREVTGERMRFVTGADELTVEKPHTVSGEEKAGGGGPVTIDADQLTLRQQRSTAVWRGHVRVTRGRTLLTAPELEATWDGAGAITRLKARGGVTATEPGRTAWGERADFDVERGVVVVTGHPEAQQGKNHFQGSRVTYFPGTDRLEVEQATTVIQQEPKKPR
jgi:lipopolysaccharide export system protein LptA